MPLSFRDRHPTRVNLRGDQALTLCEAVASMTRMSYLQRLKVAQGDTLQAQVARWSLGQECTSEQWDELIRLCCHRGPVVRSYSIPWTQGRIQ